MKYGKIIDFKETQLTFAFSALWYIEWSYRMLKWVAFLLGLVLALGV